MVGRLRLRAVAAVLLTALLLPLAWGPICESAACPMEEPARAACDPLDDDCCQAKAERPPAAAALPALAAGPAVTALAGLLLPHFPALRPPEPAASPPVLQGLRLHAFVNVLLL